MMFKINNQQSQSIRIIIDGPKDPIATGAQPPAKFSGFMRMVKCNYPFIITNFTGFRSWPASFHFARRTCAPVAGKFQSFAIFFSPMFSITLIYFLAVQPCVFPCIITLFLAVFIGARSSFSFGKNFFFIFAPISLALPAPMIWICLRSLGAEGPHPGIVTNTLLFCGKSH